MPDDLWTGVEMKDIRVGDVLRVRKDAYTGKAAEAHNGRLVKVIDRKDGDVVVHTIDMKLPYMTGTRHAPYRLERKVAQL